LGAVIEPRVYRAAFLPAVLALVVAMFSLQDEPPAPPLDTAADVIFEGDAATTEAERIVRREPDRRVGTDGDVTTAELVAESFEESGFDVDVDEFEEGGHELRNVIATRTGSERERIVVMAARDADSVPDAAGSAVDTGALMHVATALEGRAPQKTVVLASVDGSTLGDVGARRFTETAADAEHIAAVIVLSDVGAGVPEGPSAVAWSNDAARGGIALKRTAADALRREFEVVTAADGIADQFAHLALPIGVGAQGVLLEEDVDAIRLSGSGLLPPEGEPAIDPDRVGGLGRAALQTVFAIDAAPALEHGPASYVTVGEQVLPAWAVAVAGLTLILPPLVASLDALARARRRRAPVAPWGAWLVAWIVPFGVGLLVAVLTVVTGLVPDVGGAAPAPSAHPLDAGGAAALGGTAAAVVLTVLFLRPVLARWGGTPDEDPGTGAGVIVALTAAVAVLAAWVLNPFAGLALAPAAHLWMIAALGGRPSRRARALLLAGGLALPALIVALYMVRLSLDPVGALWYGFLLVAGGAVGLPAALLGCVLLGTLVAAVRIVLAHQDRSEPAEPGRPALRGPGGLAGPGSLGGTRSALRR
jgi:hypothetical protein